MSSIISCIYFILKRMHCFVVLFWPSQSNASLATICLKGCPLEGWSLSIFLEIYGERHFSPSPERKLLVELISEFLWKFPSNYRWWQNNSSRVGADEDNVGNDDDSEEDDDDEDHDDDDCGSSPGVHGTSVEAHVWWKSNVSIHVKWKNPM